MKKINQYIQEKLVIDKNVNTRKYNYHPKDKDEIKSLIANLI